jgi:broad specificity phosphatase PhoE
MATGRPNMLAIVAALAVASCGGAAVGPATSATPATATVNSAAAQPTSTTGPVVTALRTGGTYLLIRHGVADVPGWKLTAGSTEQTGIDLDDCATQVNLSEAAKRELAVMASDIATLAIEIRTVLASPYCRTLETARILFGKATPHDALLRPSYVPLPGRRPADPAAQRLAVVKQMVAVAPAGSGNVALVTHGEIVRGVTGLDLAMGETVIVRPDGSGGHVVIGRVLPAAWKAQ